jgi:hypothetical protein
MLYAQLGKRDELRIVCGACGNGMAWITEAIIGRVRLTKADWEPSAPPRPPYRYVFIPEGWFPAADGVWRPSQRARRQLRRGLPTHHPEESIVPGSSSRFCP